MFFYSMRLNVISVNILLNVYMCKLLSVLTETSYTVKIDYHTRRRWLFTFIIELASFPLKQFMSDLQVSLSDE